MRFHQRLATSLIRGCRRPVFPVMVAVIMTVAASLMKPVFGLFFAHSAVRITGFAAMVALGMYFSRHVVARVGFATLLLVLMTVSALKFGESFPFESWKLYDRPAPVDRTVCFIDVVTQSGAAYRLDQKVMGDFTSPTNHNRLASRLVFKMSPEERREFANFVVEQTAEYRAERARAPQGWRRWLRMLRFPPHQFASSWSAEDLVALEKISGIRVRIETMRLEKENHWRPRLLKQEILELPCF